MFLEKVGPLFDVDGLSLIMLVLIGFVGIVISVFSSRYLKGDSHYGGFFFFFSILIVGLLVMVLADHLLLFFLGWTVANLTLWRLMVHKPTWKAARVAGRVAFKNFLLGVFFVGCSFLLFYFLTGETSLRALDQYQVHDAGMISALSLLFLGAMAQSAIWPFSQWLGSSLNSPTPVSAMMHAGLINGGGFLLARFAPLYLKNTVLLPYIFAVGAFTTLLGILWKLMQSDIKRMLAFSTMGQMGFMIVQCGLGLFPAAVAHLCWHGLFKAYLFLSSGSVAQDTRQQLSYPPKLAEFCVALVTGLLGSYVFTRGVYQVWWETNTHLVLTFVAFIGGTQLGLIVFRYLRGEGEIFSRQFLRGLGAFFFTLLIVGCAGFFYGSSVHLFEVILTPLHIAQPQPLRWFHLLGMGLFLLSWLSFLLAPGFFAQRGRDEKKEGGFPEWVLRGYVFFLNGSQPIPDTVTALHNDYNCFDATTPR